MPVIPAERPEQALTGSFEFLIFITNSHVVLLFGINPRKQLVQWIWFGWFVYFHLDFNTFWRHYVLNIMANQHAGHTHWDKSEFLTHLHRLAPSMLREITYSSIRAGSYEPIKVALRGTARHHTTMSIKMKAGAVAGMKLSWQGLMESHLFSCKVLYIETDDSKKFFVPLLSPTEEVTSWFRHISV